jgi:hypothetical protein
MSNIIKYENIEPRIIVIQGKKVLLDIDVAELYGVETKRINEAVKNNPEKFPDNYILNLSKNEWEALKSKISTSIKDREVNSHKYFPKKSYLFLSQFLKVLMPYK